ncbi:MAG: class II aldolase/adducin family protein [Pseudomonadota bacterium]
MLRDPGKRPSDLLELAKVSARMGADPSLVQYAGGNTSVKAGDVMWIKASGTLLADALREDLFVPVDLPALNAAISSAVPEADTPATFLMGGATMRPSIETSLHAVFPQRIVLHVHCVETIAFAVRPDCEVAIADRLAGLDYAVVPYMKPGATLADAVAQSRRAQTDVVILGNHGLIVAGDTVEDARRLITEVANRLAVPPHPLRADIAALMKRAEGSAYEPAQDAPSHQSALTEWRVEAATSGSLYPDHVIFCGIAAETLRPGETPAEADARILATGRPLPPFLLVPGLGVLTRRDASEGALAMVRCLGDVLSRIPDWTALNTLTLDENAELLDWDAEAYRKTLQRGAAGG